MSRSPLFYPLNRGADADAGGAADLQTDVMRFMAILSLCLVAIFALVQSIPMTPTPTVPTPPAPVMSQEKPAEMQVEPPAEIKLTHLALVKAVVQDETIVVQHPQARPASPSSPTVLPQGPPIDSQPVDKGFTLRFATDLALTRLVEKQVVGLYVITAGNAIRMSIDNNEMSFWPASTPRQFHEMDVATVPALVTATYLRNGGSPSADSKWGVTLPNRMSRQLNQYLTEREGGSLIINAAGELRLEQ